MSDDKPTTKQEREEWKDNAHDWWVPNQRIPGNPRWIKIPRENLYRLIADVDQSENRIRAATRHVNMLLLLIDHETFLPESAANGNTSPCGTIDEGVEMTSRILDAARLYLSVAKEDGFLDHHITPADDVAPCDAEDKP